MAKHYTTVGNILRDTFILFGKDFLFNFTAVVLLQLPFLISLTSRIKSMVNYPDSYDGFWIWYSLIMVYMTAAYVIMGYLITLKACETYLGEDELPEDLLKRTLHNFIPLLLLSLLFSLGVLGGYLLLIVPGIILILAWSLYLPVFVREGLQGRAALRRSRELTRGYKGEIFGVGFVLVLILYAIMFLLIVLSFFLFRSRIATLGYSEELFYSRNFWNGYSLALAVLTGITTPFYYLVPVAFYFNLIKEKETASGEAPPLP